VYLATLHQEVYCIVSIHLYIASCSAKQSEALPVRETQREEGARGHKVPTWRRESGIQTLDPPVERHRLYQCSTTPNNDTNTLTQTQAPSKIYNTKCNGRISHMNFKNHKELMKLWTVSTSVKDYTKLLLGNCWATTRITGNSGYLTPGDPRPWKVTMNGVRLLRIFK